MSERTLLLALAKLAELQAETRQFEANQWKKFMYALEDFKLPPAPINHTPPTKEYPALMSAKQAAEYLGTAPATLGVWRTTGKYNLPYVKVGYLVKYKRDDLDAFIRARSIEHAEPYPSMRRR